MSIQSQYLQCRTSAAEAVRQVRDGDFDHRAHRRRRAADPADRAVRAAPGFPRRQGRADPRDAQVRLHRSRDRAITFATSPSSIGGATRAGGQEGWIDFIPNYFSEIPQPDRARADRRPTWCSHGLADGRARLLRAQPGRRLHDGRRRPGARGGARGEPQRAVRVRQLPRARLAGRGAGGEQRPRARSRPAEDRPGAASHRQVRRRPDRRRLDPADRLRRHSRRGRHAAHATSTTSASTPR